MNKHDFNPERCKLALTQIADHINDLGNARLIKALDAVFTDVEALHTAAQERDMILDSVMDLEENDAGYVDYDYVEAIWTSYTNDHYEIGDMNL